MGAAWWDKSSAIRHGFMLRNTLHVEQLRAWVLFFIAMHDYGKFDVRFQLRVMPVWQSLYLNAVSYSPLPAVRDCKEYSHGERGLKWFAKDHANMLGYAPENVANGLNFLDEIEETYSGRWLVWKQWLEAVTGHHGSIRHVDDVAPSPLPMTCDQRLADVDRQARMEWLSAMENLFLKPVGLSLNDTPPQYSPLLAGFCSVADWLGSRCDEKNFSYHQMSQELCAYFEEKRTVDALRTLDLAGVVGRSHSYAGVATLLDTNSVPRSMQTLVDRLPLDAGLTIVEAPTGSGKTEAALAYAWRLIEFGLADSIVFALPTQATANAMLGRLELVATKLFDQNPNVLLAHGSARFNKKFIKIKHTALEGYEQEDGWVQCSAWLAESRKRVFLGQIGVCTVDQVLISVLPVKHRFVRGFGVGRSVLVVDEIHAYDAYMYGLLEEVLRQQKESGGSALLLSATLTEFQRRQLLKSWDSELTQINEATPYPLLTWTAGKNALPFILDETQLPSPLNVKLEPFISPDMLPDNNLLERIIEAAETGAQVAIVCNLVDDAQQLAKRLREKTNLPVDLFHARFCYKHRQEKELAAIARFGPYGSRSEGRIVVATQVIEQSLDLDFDWLISQLCPIDLLFQRIGRLHRHSRSTRPAGFEHPICTVLMPEGHDYGLHGVIYANTRALWRTSKKILLENRVLFPAAYRGWIKDVYKEEPWGSEPKEIEECYEKFKYEVEYVKRCKARYMVDAAVNTFADTDEKVTAVTRDGEMKVTLVPYCHGMQGKMLMDETFVEALDEYQLLEALALNSIGVPASWRGYFEKEMADKEGRYWLKMDQKGEFYEGVSNGVTFRYHKDIGLERKK